MAEVARMTSVSEFSLNHPAGLIVSRALTEEAFLALDLGSTHRDMGTGWVWYQLPVFLDAGVSVAVALGFNAGPLELITLTDVDPRFGISWDDWSEQQERLRAREIADWLSGKGFPSGNYSWGSIWAGYDEKAGIGQAGVRFAPRVNA
jgi:hypothetical protein